jgi:hypothetical protein
VTSLSEYPGQIAKSVAREGMKPKEIAVFGRTEAVLNEMCRM